LKKKNKDKMVAVYSIVAVVVVTIFTPADLGVF